MKKNSESRTETRMTTHDGTVMSADGTRIAYERSGSGPVIVLVAPALADRKDHRKLGALLAESHTVINYDRRGRGASTDVGDWEIAREVEDIEALVDAHAGKAALFGASSGAVLALDAAAALPTKITRVVAYEPPAIVDDRRAPVPRDFSGHLATLIDQGQPARVVTAFNKVALGAPSLMVIAMRLMVPVWRSMVAMAPTTVYDVRLCEGLQDGAPLVTDRWDALTVPSLVLVGGKGEPFMKTGTKALSESLNAIREEIPGAHHGTPVMKPAALMSALDRFLE